MTRRYTKPRYGKVFDPRQCKELGCSTIYTPTGPNAPYCPEHSDKRLRKRREWHLIRARARRRVEVPQ